MRIDAELKLDFKDVLIRPKRSELFSRSKVCLERKLLFKHSKTEWEGIPLMVSNMDTVGTFDMAVALSQHRMLSAIHKHYSLDQWSEFVQKHREIDLNSSVAVSTGISPDDMKKLDQILDATGLDMICVDVANGYSEPFVQCVRALREKYPRHKIMAGNVVTGEMTEELILSGADAVKVGIGPGSVCTTRIKTGVGYPQLSAIIECSDAAHGLKGLIIADGGCMCPGDVAKAFGGGADYVMLGGMMAGHDECAGDTVVKDGIKYKQFYGMSSREAMEKHSGGVANYRAAEGKNVLVPYRGSVHDTVLDILGGLRSACTYVGAYSLKELSKRTTFVRVSQQVNPVFENQG